MPNAESLRRAWTRWRGSFSTFMRSLEKREVPFLSHSKITTVERCPQCYYSQYILGEKPSSDALTTGTLFHRAAAAFYEAVRSDTSSVVAKQLKPKHPNRLCQQQLRNAIRTLQRNAWEGYDVVEVEEIFFMNLAPGLPPVIGVVDLVLRQGDFYVVVDHKTSRSFRDPDPDQLVLYAEHVRRSYRPRSCIGTLDQYRLVPDLGKTKKAVFRRTPISVELLRLPDLLRRYRSAWKVIARIHRDRKATPSDECWTCNPWHYRS